jgi:hypothetical protein
MSFTHVTKNVGKIQKSITYWLSTILIWIFKVDYDSFKWVSPFFIIISMDLILFIFLYLRNIRKTTIVMFI